jgi:hypothetical protein
MLKTISAALVAASMLAAPAMAATVIKTERGPMTKTVVIKPSVARSHAQVVVVKKPHRHYGWNKHRHGHGQKVVIVKKPRHHF